LKALRKLTGETAIYGMPSIIGRFLNYWLFPYWTHVFVNQSNLGQVANMYAYVAFLFVILTYGMETGYFRFASRENNKATVFSSVFYLISITSALFLIAVIGFRNPIATALQLDGYAVYVVMMGITVAFDVVSTIPFAKLRLEHRPIRFALIKFVNIGTNIILNLFFLTLCPYLAQKFPGGFIDNVYRPEFGIGYVFLANLVATLVGFVMLIPHMQLKIDFDFALMRRMLKYSFPILIVGITGMVNQNIDKILLPMMLPESAEPMKQLGIYAAAFKMAVILNMFIQAFRFAFEPFFFSQKGGDNDKDMYVIVMKYFAIFGLIIFLGLSTFIDLFKVIVAPQYREGIGIVPIVLLANLFMGIYFTLSLWYKITDKTKYGAYQGIIGSVITIAINVLLIPVMGYFASAWAILVCFVSMTLISYFAGKKHYDVPYKVKNFLFYLFVALLLFGIYWWVRTDSEPYFWLAILVNVIFVALIVVKEKHEILTLIKK
jgi:O-antigen/teichoic acid export membrane protein